MEDIIEVSESLWIVMENLHSQHNDGMFYIRDCLGGQALIDIEETRKLIEVLQELAEKYKR